MKGTEPADECPVITKVQKQYIPVPGELTELHDTPPIPNSGDNAALLDWAMACGTALYLYEQQIKALRELEP